MPKTLEEFRQQLLKLEKIPPTLRESYQKELDAMLNAPLTRQAGLVGTVLAVGLLVTVCLIVRADLYYHVRGLWLVGHAALAISFLAASILIIRDLRKRKQSYKSVPTVSGVLTLAAGIMTVIALMIGLGHSSEPKYTFDAFYVFVFYFACVAWSLDNRIKSAELSSREQSLRIECRLADLGAHVEK